MSTNWPIGADPRTEPLAGSNLIGFYQDTATAPGAKQRQMPLDDLKEFMQLLSELIVTGNVVLARDGGKVLIRKTTDEGEGLQIGSGGMRIDGAVGDVIFPDQGNLQQFTRNSASYIWATTIGGYLALGGNGSSVTPANANLVLNADQTNTSVRKLTVSSGGLEVAGTVGNIISRSDGAVLEFTRASDSSAIYNSSVGGYLYFATNGRTLNTANANLVLNADQTNNSVKKLTVDSGGFEVTSGTCFNVSGTWTAISDIRVKENIKEIENPIDKVIALAKCVRHFNYKFGSEDIDQRTQFIADYLEDNGFDGHIKLVKPNEEQGKFLGWEYADEEYTEEVPKTETKIKIEREIIDGKIIEKEVEFESPVMKTVIVQKIVEDMDGENPLGTFSIADVEEQIQDTEIVTKTRRIVTKEGDLLKTVEQNFAPYAFPAIAALNDKIESQEEIISSLISRIENLEGKK